MLNRTITFDPMYIGIVSHGVYTVANLLSFYNRQIDKSDFPDFHSWLDNMVQSGKLREIKERRITA